jgi:hypothetical protein
VARIFVARILLIDDEEPVRWGGGVDHCDNEANLFGGI